MRHRKGFLIIVLLVSALVGGGLFYYNRPSVQEKIKNIVVQSLIEATGGEISIESLSIGLLSATANGFSISLNSQSVQIEIEKIKIGVGLIQFPNLSKINAQDFIDRIIIINPKIKITPYANSGDEEIIQIDSLLASQWSKIIVENVPFQSAGIRNCSIEIETTSGRMLANFSGLDGNLRRKNSEVSIELSGNSGKSFSKNINISARISNLIERQFLKMKFENVAVVSPLMQLDGELSFLLDGDMNIEFSDNYFPQALSPNGELFVKKLQVRQKNRGITFTGAMDVSAGGGILDAKNVSAKFSNGEINGFARMDLNQGGKAIGELNVNVDIGKETSLSARNLFNLTQILNPGLFFKTDGFINKKNDTIAEFNAVGKITEGQAVLRNFDVKSKFGDGFFTGFIVPGVNYSLDGKIDVNTKIDKDITALGNAKIFVKGDEFIKFPMISGNISDFKLKKEDKILDFPKITAITFNETLKISGNEKGFALSSEMKLKENFAYTANLSLTENKAKDIFAFLGRDFPLKSGNFSAKINGDTTGLSFTANSAVSTQKFGSFTTDAKGHISKKQKLITINSAKWIMNKQTLNFKGNLKNSTNGWTANLSSANIAMIAEFDSNFTEINANASINKFPFTFFNAFDKTKNKKSNLISSGEIFGTVKFGGKLGELSTNGNLKLQNAEIQKLQNLSADVAFSLSDSTIKFPAFSIKQGEKYLLRSRKLEKTGEKIFAELAVDKLPLENLLPFFEIDDVKGNISARIDADGDKMTAKIIADSIFYQGIKSQKIKTQISTTKDSIFLDRFDGEILGIKTNLDFRGNHRNFNIENAKFAVNLNGDFLAAAGSFKESPIGGKGTGTIAFSGNLTEGELNITNGRILISNGELTVFPFVRGSIENVYADVKTIAQNRVSLAVQGTLEKRNLTIRNDYNVGELTPFKVANLDLGVLRVFTDKGGIPVFLPGFMENRRGNVGYIETARKGNIPTLTVASHPDNLVTLAGTLLLRKTDITFPLLDDVEYPFDFDAFPHLFFDLDIRPADKSVQYFYQIGRENRRRGIRIIECNIDPSGTVGVRGNDADGTFKVVGRLRSHSGYMFYGRMFDQNFEIGLDFQPELLPNGGGYDNLPIIWGRAETYSDTNRLERISVKLKTRDEKTGELRERGRFTTLVISPESENAGNINRAQDETTADYYRSMGTLEQASEMAATIGDNYISGFLLNYWGRQVARKIGLDMIRFETGIMGNSLDFLTQRQLDESTTRNWNYLAFANSGITAGKYLGSDFMLKYQAELTPQDLELVPEHKIGIEYQPLPYLWMDFNYGFHRENITNDIISNPEVRLQMRMPFSDLKKLFNNNKKTTQTD